MFRLERRVKTLTISTVVVLAVCSAVAAIVYANIGMNSGAALTTYANETTDDATKIANITNPCGDFFGNMRGPGKCGHEGGFGEFIAVSQEFKDKVINITESDSDVQALISEGYNVTGVKPLINATVEANGTVTMKATNAMLLLSQNTTGRATVWVDLEQAKVTRIDIFSIKTIDKS